MSKTTRLEKKRDDLEKAIPKLNDDISLLAEQTADARCLLRISRATVGPAYLRSLQRDLKKCLDKVAKKKREKEKAEKQLKAVNEALEAL